MEALGIDLFVDDEDDRPPTDLSDRRGSQDRRNLSRGSQRRSSTATGGSTATGTGDVYSDDEDWFGLHSADSESDADGDIDPCSSSQAGLDEDDEECFEAEAEAITRLTLEVNTLLSQDSPEEAAKLLSEAEHILVAGGAEIDGLSKAALHTLWAAVLNAVGEDEKAQCLYAEAMHVLQTEAGGDVADSTSEGGSEEASQEEEEEEEA